jgi:hypothetical protein
MTAYIAVNIQGLYTVYYSAGVQGTIAVLELVGNQGYRQPPQGSPLSTGLEKSGQGQRLILIGGFCLHSGYLFCGGCEGDASPRHAKTFPLG